MERTFISMNVPNLLTVNLMAWFGFLLFILLWQFIGKRGGKSGGAPAAPTSAGADEIAGLGY